MATLWRIFTFMPSIDEPRAPVTDGSSMEFEFSLSGFPCAPNIHGQVEAVVEFVVASATIIDTLLTNVVERGTDVVRSLGSFAYRVASRSR